MHVSIRQIRCARDPYYTFLICNICYWNLNDLCAHVACWHLVTVTICAYHNHHVTKNRKLNVDKCSARDLFSVVMETQQASYSRNEMFVCVAAVDTWTMFVMLQERSGNNSYTHEALNLKYKLDNEFELIFVVSLSPLHYINDIKTQFRCSNLQHMFMLFLVLHTWDHSSLSLVSVQVGFQKILTLTYVDKFIDDVQLHFRDRYKNELEQKGPLKLIQNNFEFEDDFLMLLR